MTNTKPLSEMIEEIEVESADRMSLRNDLTKLKRVAIELARAAESIVPLDPVDGMSYASNWIMEKAITKAKDIIGGVE